MIQSVILYVHSSSCYHHSSRKCCSGGGPIHILQLLRIWCTPAHHLMEQVGSPLFPSVSLPPPLSFSLPLSTFSIPPFLPHIIEWPHNNNFYSITSIISSLTQANSSGDRSAYHSSSYPS